MTFGILIGKGRSWIIGDKTSSSFGGSFFITFVKTFADSWTFFKTVFIAFFVVNGRGDDWDFGIVPLRFGFVERVERTMICEGIGNVMWIIWVCWVGRERLSINCRCLERLR